MNRKGRIDNIRTMTLTIMLGLQKANNYQLIPDKSKKDLENKRSPLVGMGHSSFVAPFNGIK